MLEIKKVDRKQEFIDKVAKEFKEDFDEFCTVDLGLPYQTDFQLKSWLHGLYHEKFKDIPKKDYSVPVFSPSSSASCPRELYYQQCKAKRDEEPIQPHQKRWTMIGTGIGDLVQEQVLMMSKYSPKALGKPSRFRFEQTENGEPMFEEFSIKQWYSPNNKFSISGQVDGIMEYVQEDGTVLRVGLEVKSKQTTHSKTTEYSMREAEYKHIQQCVAYSIIHNLDYYIITYVNASHKSWSMDEDEYFKNGDFRVFGIHVTKEMKDNLLSRFESIVDAINDKKPPKLDISKWTFNSYKNACISEFTDEDLEYIKKDAERILKATKVKFVHNSINKAVCEVSNRYARIKQDIK